MSRARRARHCAAIAEAQRGSHRRSTPADARRSADPFQARIACDIKDPQLVASLIRRPGTRVGSADALRRRIAGDACAAGAARAPLTEACHDAFALDPLDLAALLCSRVCHDVISPVGAIVNGLEVLEEEKDAETRQLRARSHQEERRAPPRPSCSSAGWPSAPPGSAGASIDTGDAEAVTRGLFGDDKIKLDWRAPRVLMPKNKVKLDPQHVPDRGRPIPRGGVINVSTAGTAERAGIQLEAKGTNPAVNQGAGRHCSTGEPENGSRRCPCDPALLRRPRGARRSAMRSRVAERERHRDDRCRAPGGGRGDRRARPKPN